MVLRTVDSGSGGNGGTQVGPQGDSMSACTQGAHFVLKIDLMSGSGQVAAMYTRGLVYIPNGL